MNVDILDIFYKNIINEATTGRIDCFYYYNMAFSTKISEEEKEYICDIDNDSLLIPTLMIKNKKMFDSLLLEYVNLAMNFYDDSNIDKDIQNYAMYDDKKRICKEKVILALLFANATVEDFNNPCEYLRRRINFFKNDLSSSTDYGYLDILKGNVNITIDKDIINNETPLQMIIKAISNNGEEYEFPRIKFGVSDDTVYIYAIQNKLGDVNAYHKKINRVLYKIGEGYIDDMEKGGENLRDITSSFLVSLNMAISYFNDLGYNNIVVPSCLIERWNAKSIANLLKIKYKKMNEDSANLIYMNQENIQNNLTNKLVRTFLRLGCHYNNIDILSFPYEVDSCLHISFNDNNLECNNALLYETYMIVQDNKKNKHR